MNRSCPLNGRKLILYRRPAERILNFPAANEVVGKHFILPSTIVPFKYCLFKIFDKAAEVFLNEIDLPAFSSNYGSKLIYLSPKLIVSIFDIDILSLNM